MFSRLACLGIVVPALLSVACVSTPSTQDVRAGGSYVVTMNTGQEGHLRSYRLHVPEHLEPAKPVPLVVVLHGAFSTSAAMERETGFSQIADREGFVVAYPDGIGIFGLLQHWNAGHCCGKAAAEDLDDVGFVAAVIEDVKRFVEIDARRVYMVGFSNGAMLTHRFAAERPELLAGAAPLAGAIASTQGTDTAGWQMPSPQLPVPIIMFHGLRDTTIPYHESVAENASSGRRYASVMDASRYWSTHNGCERHIRTKAAALPEVTIDSWSGCDGNAVVQLYSLGEWGHRWPGAVFTESSDANGAHHGLDAAEIIWSFFEQHGRAPGST